MTHDLLAHDGSWVILRSAVGSAMVGSVALGRPSRLISIRIDEASLSDTHTVPREFTNQNWFICSAFNSYIIMLIVSCSLMFQNLNAFLLEMVEGCSRKIQLELMPAPEIAGNPCRNKICLSTLNSIGTVCSCKAAAHRLAKTGSFEIWVPETRFNSFGPVFLQG